MFASNQSAHGQRDGRSFYSIAGVLLLYLLFLMLFGLFASVHTRVDPESYHKYSFYDSLISVLIVLGIALHKRPQLLAQSRLWPRWSDITIGLCCGLLVKTFVLLCVSDPVKFLAPPNLPQHSFVQVAIIGSVIEEVLIRGIFQRSLQASLPRSASVLIIVILAAAGHSGFWLAVPAQLAFCIIYVGMGDSLAASITAHVAANVLVYLPVAGFFQKWHLFTLFKI